VNFTVKDKVTGESTKYKLHDKVKAKQLRLVSSQSDGIWQMAQHIKQEYAEQGKDVAVYAKAMVSVNGHPYKQYTDDTVDLASVKWNYFGHSDWVLLYDQDGNLIARE